MIDLNFCKITFSDWKIDLEDWQWHSWLQVESIYLILWDIQYSIPWYWVPPSTWSDEMTLCIWNIICLFLAQILLLQPLQPLNKSDYKQFVWNCSDYSAATALSPLQVEKRIQSKSGYKAIFIGNFVQYNHCFIT